MNAQMGGQSPSMKNAGTRREAGQQPAPSIGRRALDLPRPRISLVLEPACDVISVLQTPGPQHAHGSLLQGRRAGGTHPCSSHFRTVSSAGEEHVLVAWN